MERRRFLRGLVALAAGVAGAGCANNREVPATAPEVPVTGTDPESLPGDGNADDGVVDGVDDLTVTTGPSPTPSEILATPTPAPFVNEGFDWEEADDGTLVVVMSVGNDGTDAGVATVEVAVTVEGEEYVEGAVIELDGGEVGSARLNFPVDYDAFDQNPSIDIGIRGGRPETPFPTATPTTGGTATPTGEGTDTGRSTTPDRTGTATGDGTDSTSE